MNEGKEMKGEERKGKKGIHGNTDRIDGDNHTLGIRQGSL